MRGNVICSLDDGGAYVPLSMKYEATIKLEKINDQWRIVDLALGRLDCDFRINKAGWANNLLHVLALGGRELEVAWVADM